jgi:hypothetical protein
MWSGVRARTCRLRGEATVCMLLLSLRAISVQQRNAMAGQVPVDSGRELHGEVGRALVAQSKDRGEAPA